MKNAVGFSMGFLVRWCRIFFFAHAHSALQTRWFLHEQAWTVIRCAVFPWPAVKRVRVEGCGVLGGVHDREWESCAVSSTAHVSRILTLWTAGRMVVWWTELQMQALKKPHRWMLSWFMACQALTRTTFTRAGSRERAQVPGEDLITACTVMA